MAKRESDFFRLRILQSTLEGFDKCGNSQTDYVTYYVIDAAHTSCLKICCYTRYSTRYTRCTRREFFGIGKEQEGTLSSGQNYI